MWNWGLEELGNGQGPGTAETTATVLGLDKHCRIICTKETWHFSSAWQLWFPDDLVLVLKTGICLGLETHWGQCSHKIKS